MSRIPQSEGRRLAPEVADALGLPAEDVDASGMERGWRGIVPQVASVSRNPPALKHRRREDFTLRSRRAVTPNVAATPMPSTVSRPGSAATLSRQLVAARRSPQPQAELPTMLQTSAILSAPLILPDEAVDEIELEGLTTVDRAVAKMRRSASRIRTMTMALAGGVPLVKAGPTVIGVEGNANQLIDPDLQRMAELQRRLELATADSDSQRAQVVQLQAELADRDALIHSLTADIAQLETKLADAEREVETLRESYRGQTASAAASFRSISRKTSGVGHMRAVAAVRLHASRAKATVRGGSSSRRDTASNVVSGGKSGEEVSEALTYFATSGTSLLPPSIVEQMIRQFVEKLQAHRTAKAMTAVADVDWSFTGAAFEENESTLRPPPDADWAALGMPVINAFVRDIRYPLNAAETLVADHGSDGALTAVFVVIPSASDLPEPSTAAGRPLPNKEEVYEAGRSIAARVVMDEALKRRGVVVVQEAPHFALLLFPSVAAAADFGIEVHNALVAAEWPFGIELLPSTRTVHDDESDHVLYRGVRVRVGMHAGDVRWARAAHSDSLHFYGPGLAAAVAVGCMAEPGLTLCDASVWSSLPLLTALLDDPVCGFAEWTFNPFVLYAASGRNEACGDDRAPEAIRFICSPSLRGRIAVFTQQVKDNAQYRLAVDAAVPPPRVPVSEYCGSLDAAALQGIPLKTATRMMRYEAPHDAAGQRRATDELAESQRMGLSGSLEETDSCRPGCRPVKTPIPVEWLLFTCRCVVPPQVARQPAFDSPLEDKLTAVRIPSDGFGCVMIVALANFDRLPHVADDGTRNQILVPYLKMIRRVVAQHVTKARGTGALQRTASATMMSRTRSLFDDAPILEMAQFRDRFVLVAETASMAMDLLCDLLVGSSRLVFDVQSGRAAADFMSYFQAHPPVDGRAVGSGPLLVAACDFIRLTHVFSIAAANRSTPDVPHSAPWVMDSDELSRLRCLLGVANVHSGNCVAVSDAIALQWWVGRDGLPNGSASSNWHVDATLLCADSSLDAHGDVALSAIHLLVPRKRSVALLHVARSVAARRDGDDESRGRDAILAEKSRLRAISSQQGMLGAIYLAAQGLGALLHRVRLVSLAVHFHAPTRQKFEELRLVDINRRVASQEALTRLSQVIATPLQFKAKSKAGRAGAIREALERCAMQSHDDGSGTTIDGGSTILTENNGVVPLTVSELTLIGQSIAEKAAFDPLTAHPDSPRTLARDAAAARSANAVRVAHVALEGILRVLQLYLDPLWDASAERLNDDDCIAMIVRVVKAAHERVAAEWAAGKDSQVPPLMKSDSDSLLSDEWASLLDGAVRLAPHRGRTVDHSPDELSASILSHCAEFFLYLRAAVSRLLPRRSPSPLIRDDP